jgi:hypothetical protein
MDYIKLFIDNMLWVSLISGSLGLYFNSTPTMKGKMWSYELWTFASIFWIAGAWIAALYPLVIYNIVCIIFNIVGIYNHIYLADVEEAYNKSLLSLPDK